MQPDAGALEGGEYVLGVAVEATACGREVDRAPGAFQEAGAGLLFQQAQLLGDGGGCDAVEFGDGGYRAVHFQVTEQDKSSHIEH